MLWLYEYIRYNDQIPKANVIDEFSFCIYSAISRKKVGRNMTKRNMTKRNQTKPQVISSAT